MRYKSKNRTIKNYEVQFHAEKMGCAQGVSKKKVQINRKQTKLHYLNYWCSQHLVPDSEMLRVTHDTEEALKASDPV